MRKQKREKLTKAQKTALEKLWKLNKFDAGIVGILVSASVAESVAIMVLLMDFEANPAQWQRVVKIFDAAYSLEQTERKRATLLNNLVVKRKELQLRIDREGREHA